VSTGGGTLLQFGAGNFLRAFADLFVHEMNQEGAALTPVPSPAAVEGCLGHRQYRLHAKPALIRQQAPLYRRGRGDGGEGSLRIVVVQSTDGERARLLNEAGGRYYVLVCGLENGQRVERVQIVASIDRAFVAATEWPRVVEAACAPDLRAVLSNTTEAGLVRDPADEVGPPAEGAAAPHGFPARLLALLKARFDAGQPPVVLLPCELFEQNGQKLKALVREQAALWGWDRDAGFAEWLADGCAWPNSLVDRIVSGRPAAHPLLAEDPLLTVCEPYAFWAVENRPGTEFLDHPAIHRVPDITPYALRKVRILNGAHTALVAYCRKHRPDITFVREALADPTINDWVRGLLFEEVLPTMGDRVPDAEAFAHQTLERFANPFLDHKLSDIALHHDKKVPVRLVSTRDEYVARFGRRPVRLSEAIEA